MNVGVLGAGQLGRMLALAGYPLGLRCLFLDPAEDACAGQVAGQIVAPYDDPGALDRLAARCEVVTFEFENVPEAAVSRLAARHPVYPGPRALAAAQDRLNEKNLFHELGIDTPPFAAVSSRGELDAAAETIGLPLVVKTRRLGYDGKGQAVVREPAELEAAWKRLGDVPLLAEAFVPFEREVSVLGVRARSGECAFYPLVENRHRHGILYLSRPRPGDPFTDAAQDWCRRLMEALDYTGVLALELFQHDGRLLANEFAPRVHNSGHWTIEGAETSQFENHLRAICGLPLGETRAVAPTAMVNLIGNLPAREAVTAIAGAHLHDYGKEHRPGRKVGHVTLRAADEAQLDLSLQRLLSLLPG